MPNIFLTADTKITASTSALTLPKPKVHIYFRPHSKYKGEFGFDWLRTGDTNQNGDKYWYKDIIVAKTGGNYSNLVKTYDRFDHPTRDKDKYLTPYVNLLKGHTAKFSLRMSVKKSPRKIEFKCKDESLELKEYFELTAKEFSDLSEGKKSLKNHLEIKCIKEFSSDIVIQAMADDEVAGEVKFMANDKGHRYKCKVRFVKVTTRLPGQPASPAVVSGREAELKKYLRQVFITPTFSNASLDLSSGTPMTTFNNTWKTSVDDQVSAGNPVDGESIMDTLNSLLASSPAGSSPSGTYTIFFVNETAGGDYGESRDMSGTARTLVVYTLGFKDSTLAHETLHAMGLPHSFDTAGRFTFDENKTDNIMDYTDTDPSLGVEVISTWHWQWPLIRKNVKKE